MKQYDDPLPRKQYDDPLPCQIIFSTFHNDAWNWHICSDFSCIIQK